MILCLGLILLWLLSISFLCLFVYLVIFFVAFYCCIFVVCICVDLFCRIETNVHNFDVCKCTFSAGIWINLVKGWAGFEFGCCCGYPHCISGFKFSRRYFVIRVGINLFYSEFQVFLLNCAIRASLYLLLFFWPSTGSILLFTCYWTVGYLWGREGVVVVGCGCVLWFWLNPRIRPAACPKVLPLPHPPLAILVGSVWNLVPLPGVGYSPFFTSCSECPLML